MIGMEKLDDIPIPAGNVAVSVTGPEKAFIGVIDTVAPSLNPSPVDMLLGETDNAKSGGTRFTVDVAQLAGAIELHTFTTTA